MELLLKIDPPKAETANVKMKRLSRLVGQDVVFELRGLGYSRVAELRELMKPEDLPIHVILAGVAAPDLKSRTLLEKYHAAAPDELVKKLLNPGEIDDLYRKIQKLSGYLSDNIAEIKKNRQRPGNADHVLSVSGEKCSARGLLPAPRRRKGSDPGFF